MRRKKISIIGALVLGLVMSGCGSVTTYLKPNKLQASGTEMTSFTTVSGDYDSNISYTSYKGGGTSNPAVNSNVIRLYQNASTDAGGMFVVKAETSGTTITSITLGSAMATTVGYKIDHEYTGAGTETKSSYTNTKTITANGVATLSELSTTVVTFACLGTNSSSRLYVNKLCVTYTTSGAQGPVNLTNPNPQFNSSNNTISWTLDDNAERYQVKIDNGNWINVNENVDTYDVSNESEGDHTFTVKAIGDGTSYNTVEASVGFTITAPFDSTVYALCSDVKELEVGATYIITNGTDGEMNAMSTAVQNNYRQLDTVTASQSRVSNTAKTLILTLEGESGAWKFKTENYLGNDGYFAPGENGTNNKELRIVDADSADTCTISFANSVATIKFNSNDIGYLKYNNSSPRFSCYASGQQPVYLWKVYRGGVDTLTTTGQPSKTTYLDNESFNPSGITSYVLNYKNGDSRNLSANLITWPSLTDGMTTIKGSYTEFGTTVYTQDFTISVSGDTLLSISLSGNMVTSYDLFDSWDQGQLAVTATYSVSGNMDVTDDATIGYYLDSEMTLEIESPEDLGAVTDETIYVKATYQGVSNATGYSQTITVTADHGTLTNDPLTTAEAIEIGNGLAHNAETTKKYYISGVVSKIVENNLASGSYATFWLENGATTEAFEVYRINPATGCSNFTDFKVGSDVTIRCKIKRYNTTIETGSFKSLTSISFTTKVLTAISLNKNSLCLEVGGDDTLIATAVPTGAELGTVTWTSSNDNVAMVDDGYVLAMNAGNATITARVSNTIYAQCSVVVTAPTHKLASTLFSLDFTNSLSQPTDYVATCGGVTHNDNGYFVENGKNGQTTTFFTVAGGEPLFSLNNSDLLFKAKLCAGNTPETLTNNVMVVLVDMSGDEIDGTEQTFTNELTDTPTVYSLTIPYNADAYGIKLRHLKSSGYTVRFYNMELTSKSIDTYATLLATETNNGNSVSVSNVKIKFSAKISTDAWDEIITEHGEITDFGVMMFKQLRDPSEYSDTPVEDVYKGGKSYTNIHKGNGVAPAPDGNSYIFSANVNITSEGNYGVVFCAAPYVIANGEYYFLGEMQFSVNTLAQYHLNNGGSNLSEEALTLLSGATN